MVKEKDVTEVPYFADGERERERGGGGGEREKTKTEISADLNTSNDFADIFHVLNTHLTALKIFCYYLC